MNLRPLQPPVRTQTTALGEGRESAIAVPAFAGKSVREVVEQANNAGLGVQIVGSGIARDQAPAAGTLVPAGTEIVVRFAQ